MPRHKRIDLYRKVCCHISQEADNAISDIIGNSIKVGLQNCISRSDAICFAAIELSKLIEIEKKQPGSVPFDRSK